MPQFDLLCQAACVENYNSIAWQVLELWQYWQDMNIIIFYRQDKIMLSD